MHKQKNAYGDFWQKLILKSKTTYDPSHENNFTPSIAKYLYQ